MTILELLIPVTLVMGLVGLGAFFWSLQERPVRGPGGGRRAHAARR